jgi:hypothetical protein
MDAPLGHAAALGCPGGQVIKIAARFGNHPVVVVAIERWLIAPIVQEEMN